MTENPERVHCDERLPLREWSERLRKSGVTLELQAELLGYEDDRYFRRMREADDPNVFVIDNEVHRRKPRGVTAERLAEILGDNEIYRRTPCRQF